MSAFLQAVVPMLQVPVPGKTAEELRQQVVQKQAEQAAAEQNSSAESAENTAPR